MAIELSTPSADRLGAVVDALRGWQRNSAPIQLHPGDLGWHLRFGPDATAAALRTWSRGGQLLAVGLLDGPGALRVTVGPEHWCDEELARRLSTDASEPERGVLPSGSASIEAPDGTRLQDLLTEVGWQLGESWTPLRRGRGVRTQEAGLHQRHRLHAEFTHRSQRDLSGRRIPAAPRTARPDPERLSGPAVSAGVRDLA